MKPAEVRDRALAGPVAILGMGVSGRAAAELIERLGGRAIACDEAAGKGSVSFPDLVCSRECTLAVASPGISPEHPWLALAGRSGLPVIPEIALGRAWAGSQLFAITGTNGKTTATRFLAAVLSAAGVPAVACGNLGVPLSQVVGPDRPDRVPIVEVSSFQAELLNEFSATGVAWTNFAEDHLDRHPDLGAYFRAKRRLLEVAGEGALLVGGLSVPDFAHRLGEALPSRLEIIEAGAPEPPSSSALAEGPFREDYALVHRMAVAFGVPDGLIQAAAADFQRDPSRFTTVAVWRGIRFIDDSKATNFSAALAAVQSAPRPILWLGGGSDKGGDVPGFCHDLAPRIDGALTFGSSGTRLAAELATAGVPGVR